MADETTVLTPDGIESPGDSEKQEQEKSLMVAKDLLPETMMVIPLHDRPMFPKMMGPVIIDDATLQQSVLKHVNQNAPLHFALILQRPTDDGMAHPATKQESPNICRKF